MTKRERKTRDKIHKATWCTAKWSANTRDSFPQSFTQFRRWRQERQEPQPELVRERQRHQEQLSRAWSLEDRSGGDHPHGEHGIVVGEHGCDELPWSAHAPRGGEWQPQWNSTACNTPWEARSSRRRTNRGCHAWRSPRRCFVPQNASPLCPWECACRRACTPRASRGRDSSCYVRCYDAFF